MNSTRIEAAALSHPGQDPQKQVNEDSFFNGELPLGYLAIVCDGMGGHRGGKEASELAVATIVRELTDKTAAALPSELLVRAIERANERVFALGGDELGGRPGSTIVLCLFTDQGVWIAHVGDSRVIRLRADSASALTRDHSAVRELVDAGVLTLEQAKHHPEANKITRALGVQASVDVEITPIAIPYGPGDTFVLCSDGLSDLLEPSDLLAQCGEHLGRSAQGMVDLANARGGHDNITALLVRTHQASRVSATTLTEPAPSERRVSGRPLTEVMPREARGNPTVVMGPPAPPPPPSAPALIPQNRTSPATARGHSTAFWLAIVVVAVLITALATAAVVLVFGARLVRPTMPAPSASYAPPAPPVATASASASAPPPAPTIEEVEPVPTLAPVKPKPRKRDPESGF